MPVTLPTSPVVAFVQYDDLLRIGAYVALRIEGYGECPAQIRWALGDEAGGRFLEPIVCLVIKFGWVRGSPTAPTR